MRLTQRFQKVAAGLTRPASAAQFTKLLRLGVITILWFAVVPWAAADSATVAMTVRPEGAADLDGVEVLRSIDYGSFVWLEVAAHDRAAVEAQAPVIKVFPRPFELVLAEQAFDPLRSTPILAQGWGASESAAGPDLHLVQLVGPTRSDWIRDLEDSGLEIVQYIHPNTYVVWGDEGMLTGARQAAAVRWAGPFALGYRVLPSYWQLGAERLRIDALLYRGSDIDVALGHMAGLGAVEVGQRVLNETWLLVGFELSGNRLRDAAGVPGVYSLQPVHDDGGHRGEIANQVNAGNVDDGNVVFPGYQEWLDDVVLRGTGVVMANVDGGVQDDHPDLVGRMTTCVGETCAGGAHDAHGTHTAGIMVADGSSVAMDPAGFERGLGVAPGAAILEQLYSPFLSQPGGMSLLMEESSVNGAVLSNNSWGPSGFPQGYDDDTLQVDIGVRDADPHTGGNQALTYVLSIMNGYGGVSTQGTPDEAKNTFTIGSTKLQESDLSQSGDIDDLSHTSAHGPALDGRIIPHMVAPGCYVDSTWPTDTHNVNCGTSMASPSVSGAIALFVEQRRLAREDDPSPALIKAAFLPVAHDLAGNVDADGFILGHPFDSRQGWGRLDLAAVVAPEAPVLYRDQPVRLDNTGEFWGFSARVFDLLQPVRIMLVWTDAPGHGLGGSTPAWNNDLDLEVEFGGGLYRGNAFDPLSGWSIPGAEADGMNNTEGVFLEPSGNGIITVRVLASNISSDGVPDVGDGTDQDFALVCYNCVTPETIFFDGFERADASAWSLWVDGS